MIDLETLARDRARVLSQPISDWIEAVHNQITVKACTFLTDGEIEQIFAGSDSPQSLTKIFAAIAADGENADFKKCLEGVKATARWKS